LIVQLIQAVAEIAITGGHRVIVVIRLDERRQGVQYRRRLVRLQPVFLHVQPRLRIRGGSDLGRFAQILAQMEEIDSPDARSVSKQYINGLAGI
jgi:hypothetical protein